MNAQKHTPGPWVIIPAIEYDGDDPDLDGSFTCPASIEGSDGSPICTFGSENGSGILFENEADYHLIAAAPDLLAMLKVAQLWLDVDGRYDMQGINAAIAKAEARS